MRLKPVKKVKDLKIGKETPKKEETKKTTNTKKGDKKSFDDKYKPLLEPVRFLVREMPSLKDPNKVVKQYVEMSVKRFDEDKNDIENPVTVYMQMYQESDFYTGYLKGKSIHVPLDSIYDLIDGLSDLAEECERNGIE